LTLNILITQLAGICSCCLAWCTWCLFLCLTSIFRSDQKIYFERCQCFFDL